MRPSFLSFRAYARNPQNTLSCWATAKHLTLNASIQEVFHFARTFLVGDSSSLWSSEWQSCHSERMRGISRLFVRLSFRMNMRNLLQFVWDSSFRSRCIQNDIFVISNVCERSHNKLISWEILHSTAFRSEWQRFLRAVIQMSFQAYARNLLKNARFFWNSSSLTVVRMTIGFARDSLFC